MKYSLILSLMLFAACSSKPKQTSNIQPTNTHQTVTRDVVDLDAIKKHLGINRYQNDLGYIEKQFNTCEVGYGFPNSSNCTNKYLVNLNIRLQCRDSVGTISNILTESDLRPLRYRTIKWTMKNLSGSAKTDENGFLEILVISNNSQDKERIKIASSNDFLYMRTHDIRSVITPKPWCD